MAYKEVVVKKPLSLIILPYVSLILFFGIWQAVVQFGIIPNTLLADDQTRRAELIAKHAPVIVNACETEEALAAAVHEVITLTKNLKAYPKAQLNGAELAAQALLNLAGRRSA